MQTDRGTRSRPIIEGQEGAQRSCVCRARSFALRRRPAGHTAAAGESDRVAGEILRGDQRAQIEEIAISGLARTGQGHQNDKESRSLGRPTDSSPWGVCLIVQDHTFALPLPTTMQENEADREARLRELASKLFFTLQNQGFRFALYRDVDVPEPIRHDGLTLDEVEDILNTWKLRGPHGG